MENRTTIVYLNSKAWYRLLKVLFGAGLVAVLLVFNIIVFSGGVKQLDQNKTTIRCGPHMLAPVEKNNIFTLKDIGLSLSASDFKNGQVDIANLNNNYALASIQSACSVSQGSTVLIEEISITPMFTYAAFFELFFIGNFIILLAFEGIRRAFYYVVLGKIRLVK